MARKIKIYFGFLVGVALTLPIYQARAISFFNETKDATKFVKNFYWFGVAIVGAVAMGALVLAGVNYMRSQGNEEHVTKAKELFASALVGLFLVMGSYILLNTLDPRLVEFKITTIDMKGATEDTGTDKAGDNAAKCSSDKDCTGFSMYIYECNFWGNDTKHRVKVNTKCINGGCYVPEGGACGIDNYGSSAANGLHYDIECQKDTYGGSSLGQKCSPSAPNCKSSSKESSDMGWGFNVIDVIKDDPNVRTCQK